MKEVKIETNFYGWILWNIPLLWRSHNTIVEKESAGLSSSNVYVKSAEVDCVDNASKLVTNHISSPVKKIGFMQIALLKYLLPLIAIYMFMYMNLYYPSMVGLCIASVTYLIFWQLVRRVNMLLAVSFIVTGLSLYIYFVINNFNTAIDTNLSSILNYALQYMAYLYILEAIFIDLLINRVKSTYKVINASGSYFSILDENKSLIDSRKKIGRRVFVSFLGFVAVISFILGGVDLLHEIDLKDKIEKKALAKQKEQKGIQDIKDFEVFKSRLDKRAKEVGINYHSGTASLKLMKKDLDSYKKNGVVGYDKIRVTRTNKILRLKDKKIIPLTKMKVSYFIKPSYIKMYEGDYRWHFLLNGKVHIVMNSTAR